MGNYTLFLVIINNNIFLNSRNNFGIIYEQQGFIQGVVGGALAPPCSFKCPLEKTLTQRMKRCDLVPAPFKNLHIPDCPPCIQILYETLNTIPFLLVSLIQ